MVGPADVAPCKTMEGGMDTDIRALSGWLIAGAKRPRRRAGDAHL